VKTLTSILSQRERRPLLEERRLEELLRGVVEQIRMMER
jgi:hypothetical protein